MNNYAGSGIILLEYFAINNIYELCVILVHNKYKNHYDCPGGKLDYANDNIYNTAIKELREETCNLFNLSKKILSSNYSVKIKSGRRLYNAFILHIIGPDILRGRLYLRFYYHNRNIIRHNTRGIYLHSWNETNKITRVSIKQFVKDYHNIYSKDIY